jgi:hypothetical protein
MEHKSFQMLMVARMIKDNIVGRFPWSVGSDMDRYLTSSLPPGFNYPDQESFPNQVIVTFEYNQHQIRYEVAIDKGKECEVLAVFPVIVRRASYTMESIRQAHDRAVNFVNRCMV